MSDPSSGGPSSGSPPGASSDYSPRTVLVGTKSTVITQPYGPTTLIQVTTEVTQIQTIINRARVLRNGTYGDVLAARQLERVAADRLHEAAKHLLEATTQKDHTVSL